MSHSDCHQIIRAAISRFNFVADCNLENNIFFGLDQGKDWLADEPEFLCSSNWSAERGTLGLFHDHCLGTELEKALFFDFVYTNETCGEANLQLHILVLAAVGEQRLWPCYSFGLQPPLHLCSILPFPL